MSFQQDTGRSQGRGDQNAMGPSPTYPQATQPPFSPSNFQYSTSDYPSLENDLNMADAFPPSIASQLQEAAVGPSQRNGDTNSISVNTNGSISAGMGPPHTPHKLSFSPTGARESIDETPDSATAVEGSNKRRRSKVSRACDACRRKKIKCDSADTTDNTIKTCTNCLKANMTCEFSRVPMKRGPSKGYIKELSERVEKMESRQAAMGQPGFRHSLDGSSILDAYSPDDPMSAKRQFSFSSDVRNPFGPTDYQRERMPSAGGTWSNEFSARMGSRDRGSLALAPDQHLPGPTSAPLWENMDDLEPPAPKRRKMDTDAVTSKMDYTHLANYEDVVHSDFPLLPDRATTATQILTPAQNTEALKVFATVIGLLPSSRATHQNGNGPKIVADASLYSTAKELSEVLGKLMLIDNPIARTNQENLLLIWSCILLALEREFDIRTNRTDLEFASRPKLLKAAKELSEILISTLSSTSEEDHIILKAAKEAKTLTNVMIRFDWFASGTEPNWSKVSFIDLQAARVFSREDYGMFTANPSAKFMVRVVHCLELLVRTVHLGTAADNEYSIFKKDSEIERTVAGLLDGPDAPVGFDDSTLIVRQAFDFMTLLASPFNFRPMAPATIMEHVVRLAASLTEATPAFDESFRYNFIDYHLFTLTVITLLAFVDKVGDAKGISMAEETLNRLTSKLEQKLVSYQTAIKKREEEGQGHAEFYGKDVDGKEVQNITWMEALLKMIADKPKEKWAASKEPAQMFEGQGGADFQENILLLLRTGYGRVLAGCAGRVVVDSQE